MNLSLSVMLRLRNPFALPRATTCALRHAPLRTVSNSAPDSFTLAEVDVSALFSPSPDPVEVGVVARALSKAAQQHGFLYLSGSPISPLISDVFRASDWVFSLPPAVKQAIETPNAQRGYHRFSGAPTSLLSSTQSSSSPADFTHADEPPAAVVGQADAIEAFTVQNDDVPQEGLRGRYDDLALLEPHELLPFTATTATATAAAAANGTGVSGAVGDEEEDGSDYDEWGSGAQSGPLFSGFAPPISGFTPPISGFSPPISGFAPPTSRVTAPLSPGGSTSSVIAPFSSPLPAPTTTAASSAHPLTRGPYTPTGGTGHGFNRWPPPLPSLPPYPAATASSTATPTAVSSPAAAVAETSIAATAAADAFRSSLRSYFSACARTGDAVSAALAGGLTFCTTADHAAVGAAVLAAVRGASEVKPRVNVSDGSRNGNGGVADVDAAAAAAAAAEAVNEVVASHGRRGHTLELKRYPRVTAEDARARKGLPLAALAMGADTGEAESGTGAGAGAGGAAGSAVEEGQEVALRMPVHSDLSTLTFLVQSHDKGGLLLRDKNTGT